MRQSLVLVVLIALVALTPSALAHAEPAESSPAKGARLDASPEEVWVRFTEKIDPAATTLVIVDIDGNEIPLSELDVSDDRLMARATVPEVLPPGGYGIQWEVLSTTDGHTTFGTIPFAIGASAAIPEGQEAADQGIRIDAVIGKAFMFIGLALMAGTFAFWYLILPRGQRKGHEQPMERLGTVAGWMHLAGIAVFAYSQWQLSGQAPSDYFYGTTFGKGLVQRFFLGVIVLVGMTYAMRHDETPPWAWALTAFALFLLFIVYGRFSHTAGFVHPEWVGVAADTVHLLSISVWTGGLVAFVLFLNGLPERVDDLAEHLRKVPLRFSNTAFGSVIVASASGLFMVWAVVGFDYSLWGKGVYAYGLMAKIGLAVVMILMGAWNKLRYVMRYARQGGIHTVHLFRKNVQREVFVAAAVFLLAALITNTSPPIYPQQGATDDFDVPDIADERLTLVAESDTYNWTVTFHPPPALNRETHFIVELFVREEGVKDTNATRVWIDIENTDRPELGTTTVETNATRGGTYDAYGAYFTFPGHYNVTVHARSNQYGVFQESVVFAFDVRTDS